MDPSEKLIVFLKAPRPGEVKTRLAESLGAEGACAAYRSMLATLLNGITGLPGELCYAPADAAAEIERWRPANWTMQPQVEGLLGRRLAGAFTNAFAGGARSVVIIGSDCPWVTPADICEAWQALRTCDAVVGPASDGGYWLIGLSAPRPDLFEGIAWGGDKVFEQTVGKAAALGLKLALLRRLSDVDTESDWRAYQRDFPQK